MSGLESLAVLGIACNVMQIISFGRETVATCRTVFRTGSVDPDLDVIVGHLNRVLLDVKTTMSSAPNASDPAEKELFLIAEGCQKIASQLVDEVKAVTSAVAKGKGKPLLATWVVLKSKSREKKVKDLEKTLEGYQRTLEMGLLLKISRNINPESVQKMPGFDKIDGVHRNFIEALARGQIQMSLLLSKEAASTKQHITMETSHATNALATHVSLEACKVSTDISVRLDRNAEEQLQQRVLRSLKYEKMNARRNMVADAYDRTFEWIFNTAARPRVHYSQRIDDNKPFGLDLDGWDECFGVPCPQSHQSEDGHESSASSTAKEPLNEEILAGLSESVSPKAPWNSFISWLKSPQLNAFWISGKPGSGKTTLVKFLIQHPRTQDALDGANPDTLILSHFLWAAGSPMERSTKGIYSSLLYQLLADDGSLLQPVIQRFPHVTTKDTNYDWSENDVKAALFFVLHITPRPKCIFVDGLDEIDPSVMQVNLHRLLDQFYEVPRVKICISSRPERIFQHMLGRFPMLRVQDLTEPDVRLYTSEQLKSHFKSIPSQISSWKRRDIRSIIDAVCFKANGVFLWVAMALKILLRGFANEDIVADLLRRLDVLPAHLNALYSDMWNRLNEDRQIYRQDAARIFNTVIDFMDNPITKSRFDRIMAPLIVLALDQSWADTIRNDIHSFPLQDFERACQKLLKDFQTRCAGLVEIFFSSGGRTDVAFIHRSARDFLETNPEGRTILSLDKRSLEERRFALATAEILFGKIRVYHSLEPWFTHYHISNIMVELFNFASACLRGIDNMRTDRWLPMNNLKELISLWANVYDDCAEHIRSIDGHKHHDLICDSLGAIVQNNRTTLLSVVVNQSISHCPAGFSASYKGYLLNSVPLTAWRLHYTRKDTSPVPKIVEFLLRFRINPNIRGLDPSIAPFHQFWTRCIRPYEGYFRTTSPAISILVAAFEVNVSWSIEFAASNLALASMLLDAGMALSEFTILCLRSYHEPSGGLHHYSLLRSFRWRDDKSSVYFLEANLSFLLERILWQATTIWPELTAHSAVPKIKDAINGTSPTANTLGIQVPHRRTTQDDDHSETETIFAPRSQADRDSVVETLDRQRWWLLFRDIHLEHRAQAIELARDSSLEEHMEAIIQRSAALEIFEFAEPLVEKGLVVKGNFASIDWPPKRYDD